MRRAKYLCVSSCCLPELYDEVSLDARRISYAVRNSSLRLKLVECKESTNTVVAAHVRTYDLLMVELRSVNVGCRSLEACRLLKLNWFVCVVGCE